MTDTRTSEALSDVDWLRGELPYECGIRLEVGSPHALAIADALESKDRAYADLSHLCANYKAEIERLAFHKADVDATNERLRQEVVPLQRRLEEARAEIERLTELVREAFKDRDASPKRVHFADWLSRAKDLAHKGVDRMGCGHTFPNGRDSDRSFEVSCPDCYGVRAVAVPQEGNK